ncbi:MAG: cytochrome c3 family protein [Gammaproteobacteria bacterium]|nr:cytochrome c3 family protein [Gammaproteobacteria bacterium]
MSSKFAWLFGAVALLSTSLYVSRVIGERPFHPNLECAGCHLAGQGTTAANASQLTSSQEALCGQCHRGALELSHPSGFRPNRKLPAEYPLDWKGDMTCSSCHNIHDGKAGLIRGDKQGKQFCLTCHDASFFSQMVDKGVSLQRFGHLAARKSDMQRELDTYSIKCMDCHQGSGEAPQVSVDARGVIRHSGGINHPVGSDYEKASRSGLYKPVSQLRPGIHLPQGKVSCVSCHVGYSKKHGDLVMPNLRSALCLECHDL